MIIGNEKIIDGIHCHIKEDGAVYFNYDDVVKLLYDVEDSQSKIDEINEIIINNNIQPRTKKTYISERDLAELLSSESNNAKAVKLYQIIIKCMAFFRTSSNLEPLKEKYRGILGVEPIKTHNFSLSSIADLFLMTEEKLRSLLYEYKILEVRCGIESLTPLYMNKGYVTGVGSYSITKGNCSYDVEPALKWTPKGVDFIRKRLVKEHNIIDFSLVNYPQIMYLHVNTEYGFPIIVPFKQDIFVIEG